MFDPFHSQQLEHIIEELRKTENEEKRFELATLLMLHRVDHKLGKIFDLLSDIVEPKSKSITSINITQQGESPMSVSQGPLAGIAAGASALLTANCFDPNGLPSDPAQVAKVTFVWTSSDPVNFPITSSGTAGDQTATVTTPADATADATATISVAFAAPIDDGSNATGSATESIITTTPPPPPPVSIAQLIITQA